MPNRLPLGRYLLLAFTSLCILGVAVRWLIDAIAWKVAYHVPEASPPLLAAGFSVWAGLCCAVIAAVAFSFADQWPVRIGGLSLLLGLGLFTNLPLVLWAIAATVGVIILLALGGYRTIRRA